MSDCSARRDSVERKTMNKDQAQQLARLEERVQELRGYL